MLLAATARPGAHALQSGALPGSVALEIIELPGGHAGLQSPWLAQLASSVDVPAIQAWHAEAPLAE